MVKGTHIGLLGYEQFHAYCVKLEVSELIITVVLMLIGKVTVMNWREHTQHLVYLVEPHGYIIGIKDDLSGKRYRRFGFGIFAV